METTLEYDSIDYNAVSNLIPTIIKIPSFIFYFRVRHLIYPFILSKLIVILNKNIIMKKKCVFLGIHNIRYLIDLLYV